MFCERTRTTSFMQDLLLCFLKHLVWTYLEGKMMLFLPHESPYQDVFKEIIELICLHVIKPILSFLTGKIAGATRNWFLIYIAPKMSYCFKTQCDEAIRTNPV